MSDDRVPARVIGALGRSELIALSPKDSTYFGVRGHGITGLGSHRWQPDNG